MRIYLLVTFSCLFPLMVWGQQVIVNSNGDKIIMYPDGSWRAVEAHDSVLLKQNLQKSEAIFGPEQDGLPESSRNKAEEQNFLIRQAQELQAIILEEDKKVQAEFREATNSQFKAAEYLQNAEANKSLIESDRILSLNEDYERSVKQLREAKLKQKEIKKLSIEVMAMTNDPEKIKKNQLSQLKSKYNLFLTNYEHEAVPFATNAKVFHYSTSKSNAPKKEHPATTAAAIHASTTSSKASKETYSSIPPANRPKSYLSKPYECKISIDTIDKDSHRRQVQVAPSLIFTHTDPDLRPYFKDKELITCRGSVVKIGPYTYLTVEFQIASSYSQNNFGALQKESLLRFRLLTGDYVSLYNIKTDRGHIDAYSGNTVFTGQYAVGKKDIKKLKAAELDKIRVLWTTGYEDYDVYCIDFFKNQMNCLEEAE